MHLRQPFFFNYYLCFRLYAIAMSIAMLYVRQKPLIQILFLRVYLFVSHFQLFFIRNVLVGFLITVKINNNLMGIKQVFRK